MDIDDDVTGRTWDVTEDGTNRLDELFHQLSHPVRRDILVELVETDDDVLHYNDLITGVANARRTKVSLYHDHLPRLASAGYIDWNHEDGTILPGPRFQSVAPAVDQLFSLESHLPGSWR